ncbi:hypothetical protein B0T24DRAFT_632449 [Lasiosphaeria ovina]|uniref:Uncharacterized protein n=1 Tax=Lasiosphaeria ovina TaxID=92902 RepID=A0AAE0K4M7_9PEZI|nr:hypothetical protein B0T24DRAFT_632449 [Lasiosphaeria ovina]
MYDNANPIPGIVEATGLPPAIWPSAPPEPTPKLAGVGYKPSGEFIEGTSILNLEFWNWIPIHDMTVHALQHLPAAQVLGHATLVQTPSQLTAMVSIVEAATVSMGESYCQLLWILVKAVERAFRSVGEVFHRFSWKQEISHEEHLRNISGGDFAIPREIKGTKNQQREIQG